MPTGWGTGPRRREMAEIGERARPAEPRGYPVPVPSLHRSEETIRKSRFVTSLGRVGDLGQARAFIDGVRAEFPAATHHCWAYNAVLPAIRPASG